MARVLRLEVASEVHDSPQSDALPQWASVLCPNPLEDSPGANKGFSLRGGEASEVAKDPFVIVQLESGCATTGEIGSRPPCSALHRLRPRLGDLPQQFQVHLRVDAGRADGAVAQDLSDSFHSDALTQQLAGRRMPEDMRPAFRRMHAGSLQGRPGDMPNPLSGLPHAERLKGGDRA